MADKSIPFPPLLTASDIKQSMSFPDAWLENETPHCAGFTRNVDGSLIGTPADYTALVKTNG